MKKTTIGIISLLFLLTSSYAQTRGLGVKENISKIIPTIELNKNQICNVYSIAYSPDGKYIAAGYDNTLVRLWNAKTGSLIKTFEGHTKVVWSVAFSPDGKYLISGSADKTIKQWNVETGELIRTFIGHENTVSFVTYDTGGGYIASGSADGTIKFWDPEKGNEVQTLKGHKETIAAISYSANGKYMSSASWDNNVKIYYAVSGKEIRTLDYHNDKVFGLDFSLDGKYLASGSADCTVKVWNVEKEKEAFSLKVKDAVWDVAFSVDSKYLSAGTADGTVYVWNVETGKVLYELKGHTSPVRSIGFSSDGKYLSSGDSGGMIKMWNMKTGELLVTILQCNNGEWVTWTPEGYLDGSKWAIENLEYSVNGEKIPLDKIYNSVYRPDLVAAKILGEDSELAAETNVSIISKIVEDYNTQPTAFVEVEKTDGNKRDVNVSIKVTDRGSGIGRVFLKLNGRLILVSSGIQSRKGKAISYEHIVSLRHGLNTISAVVYNKNNSQEVSSNEITTKWNGNPEKARLFVLSAAINDYKDSALSDLNNCINDSDGIVKTFQDYSGSLYTDVFVKSLKDQDVTSKNLTEQIKKFGKAVTADDVFVLYLAGHGRTYTDGDYYFIPQDFKYKDEESIAKQGVSKWQLIEALSTIKAGNFMIILDTCNAASFLVSHKQAEELASLDKAAIIERFASKAGYDMLAACSSYQVAMDDYNGHGIFTYHVIEAIKGKADLNKDSQITSTELSYYVISEVPRNSNKKWGYKQEPQRVLPNLDYPITGELNPKEGRSLEDALSIADFAEQKGLTVAEAKKILEEKVNEEPLKDEKKNSSAGEETEYKKIIPWTITFGGDVLFNPDKVFYGGYFSERIYIKGRKYFFGFDSYIDFRKDTASNISIPFLDESITYFLGMHFWSRKNFTCYGTVGLGVVFNMEDMVSDSANSFPVFFSVPFSVGVQLWNRLDVQYQWHFNFGSSVYGSDAIRVGWIWKAKVKYKDKITLWGGTNEWTRWDAE